MSVIETIKGLVGMDSSLDVNRFRCNNCGHEFDSAKDPSRAQCMECMDHDVERVSGE